MIVKIKMKDGSERRVVAHTISGQPWIVKGWWDPYWSPSRATITHKKRGM